MKTSFKKYVHYLILRYLKIVIVTLLKYWFHGMYEKFTFMCWINTIDSVLSIAVWTQSGLLGKKGGKNSVYM